ncbi:hypothetical protein [Nocardioides sp.]|uniref:hypothetical protein n=1 Tax=Nocardioides sp. TaxID=35761 RepID=UPI003D1116B9
MSETNRRKFLAVAGAGAAAGTVGLTGLATPAAAAAPGDTKRKPGSAQETVVAYVKDHRSSKLRLMVGDREVIVHDADLVNRILNAAGGN